MNTHYHWMELPFEHELICSSTRCPSYRRKSSLSDWYGPTPAFDVGDEFWQVTGVERLRDLATRFGCEEQWAFYSRHLLSAEFDQFFKGPAFQSRAQLETLWKLMSDALYGEWAEGHI